ncbi:hypothetical protein ACXITX_20045 [Vibrio parahaemolyticus]
MPKTNQKLENGSVVTLTFSEDQPCYQAPDVASFINELSRLYVSTIRALREKKIEYKDNSLDVLNILDASDSLVDEIREQIQANGEEWLKRRIEIYSHPKMHSTYSDFIRHIEKDEKLFLSTRPDWPPHFHEDSDVLRIANINYNSPFKIGLNGYILPLMLTIIICGGSFEGLGFKIETNGLVDTTLKIRKELSQPHTDKEIIEMIKKANPDSPILDDVQRLIDKGIIPNDNEAQQ